MFAQQHASFEQRKRGREDDELAANGMSFGEHRNVSHDSLGTKPKRQNTLATLCQLRLAVRLFYLFALLSFRE